MFSFMRFNDKIFSVQTVEENLSLHAQVKVNWTAPASIRNSFLGAPSKIITFELTRFLFDDTFNLKLVYTPPKTTNFFTKVNLNNNLYLNSALGGEYAYSELERGDVVNHTSMHNKALREANEIIVHYSYTNLKSGTNVQFLSNSTNLVSLKLIPKSSSVVNHFALQSDEVLIFRSPKTFFTRLDFSHIRDESDLSYENDPNQVFNWNVSHTNLVFVPAPLNKARPSENVFKIYAFNDNYSSPDFDHTLNKVEYQSSQFKGKLGGAFIPNATSSTIKLELVDDILGYYNLQAKEIGVYKVTDSTYADYEKGQAVIGSSSESVTGEVYPYFLKGEYRRDFLVDATAVFNNAKVSVYEKIDQPYLDVFLGQVKLEITSNSILSHEVNLQLLYLSFEVIKQIRLENAKKSFYPLAVLIKSSNEKI